MRPAGEPRRREGRVERAAARGSIPRQFGPTSLAPCAAHERRRRSCAAAPVVAGLGKPGRDDAGAGAVPKRACGGFEHARGRNADDGEVDGIRDLVDDERPPATGSPVR